VVGADLALRVSGQLALFAGVELSIARRLVVEVGDVAVGRQPPLQASALLGLRF
jgi:hypothetical protein